MKTVLAAHPERHTLKLIEVNLQRQGYRVLMANSTDEAITLALEQRPDLVVLDWMMTELQAALKNDVNTRDIPIRILPLNGKLALR